MSNDGAGAVAAAGAALKAAGSDGLEPPASCVQNVGLAGRPTK
jgi:hypothetical protein